ncbi:MAG: phosphodiester glycosidase family protein [Gemmatimonadaceae bacterium]
MTRGIIALIAAGLALVAPRSSQAQDAAAARPLVADSSAQTVVPGVTLRRIARAGGPWIIHVLTVDLARRDLSIDAARACDRFIGRERPSAISHRLNADGGQVVAVINAGFFDLEGGTGISENNVVVDGEIVKGVAVTESPFDRAHHVHSQVAIERDGRPTIEQFRLTGSVRSARGRWTLGTINGAPVPGAVALYTEWMGRAPRFPASVRSVAVPLERIRSSGDTLRYRVRADSRDSTADTSSSRALLVGAGTTASSVASLRAGDIVTVVATFAPGGTPRALVGGWPRIVRGGVSVAAQADSVEGTGPKFSAARHPRSAIGITRGGDTLLIVAVDGRQAASVGMTLTELAQTMLGLGAWDALNLDGGGSTALVVRDSVVSSPSDPTGERPVGDVLLVRRGANTGALHAHGPAKTVVASCVMTGNRDPDR